MKNSILKYLPFLLLFVFSSCEIENEMTDDELIDAIINSNEKVQIIEADLPIDAKNTLINDMPDDFFDNGNMIFSGRSHSDNLMEIIELNNHPWYLGCQFHPEFTSSPVNGHPLFNGFIKASIKNKI